MLFRQPVAGVGRNSLNREVRLPRGEGGSERFALCPEVVEGVEQGVDRFVEIYDFVEPVGVKGPAVKPIPEYAHDLLHGHLLGVDDVLEGQARKNGTEPDFHSALD